MRGGGPSKADHGFTPSPWSIRIIPMNFLLNARPTATWPSIAAPGVSLCGKARGSEGRRRKEKPVFKATLYEG